MGETTARGAFKSRLVGIFHKNIKQSKEFKVFGPPRGSVEFNMSAGAAAQDDSNQAVRIKSSGFTIQCNIKKPSI